MKELKTKIMKRLLKSGIHKAKKVGKPSEGMMRPLFTKELKNGWYYQIDWVHDSRIYDRPTVVVHAFKPPRVYWAKSAEYYLRQR